MQFMPLLWVLFFHSIVVWAEPTTDISCPAQVLAFFSSEGENSSETVLSVYQELLEHGVHNGLIEAKELEAMVTQVAPFDLAVTGPSEKHFLRQSLRHIQGLVPQSVEGLTPFLERARTLLSRVVEEQVVTTKERIVNKYRKLNSPAPLQASFFLAGRPKHAFFLPRVDDRIFVVGLAGHVCLWDWKTNKSESLTTDPKGDHPVLVGVRGGPVVQARIGKSLANSHRALLTSLGMTFGVFNKDPTVGVMTGDGEHILFISRNPPHWVRAVGAQSMSGTSRAMPQMEVASSIAVADDRNVFFSANGRNLLEWNAKTFQVTRTHSFTTFDILSLAYSSNVGLAAGGDGKIVIYRWDESSSRLKAPPPYHTQVAKSLAFSPDGSLLAVGTESGNCLIWNTVTETFLGGWKAHSFRVATLSFSSDNEALVTTSGADESARAWKLFPNNQ